MSSPIALRHDLHRQPELSGGEAGTARRLLTFFEPLSPDSMLSGLGGNGLAISFGDAKTGPTVMLRSELDALPISEQSELPYRSRVEHVSHKCGHDGHMAILAAVGLALAKRRPVRGRVVLLFQPAEETGQGAAAVLADPRFETLRPDFVYALHNVPGFPAGEILTRRGAFTCASRGVEIELVGRTAHAAQPETGTSPAAAMCTLVETLNNLPGQIPLRGELAFGTVVGARLGARAFGTAPGDASVMATLRSETDATMTRIVAFTENLVREVSDRHGLRHTLHYADIFPATVNSTGGVEILHRAAGPVPVRELAHPFRWSEDFGHFTAVAEGALFGLGAGEGMPELHHADYDFPDRLIQPGARIFLRIVAECLRS